ncbi:hypothetical protein [Neisseria musculi]|uniref:hypothetical protein n=1 Tax=Neisseria musculi TaxID=1815583 RepID=UPI0036137E21
MDEKQFFCLLHNQPLGFKRFFLNDINIISLFDCNLKFKYKNTARGLDKLNAVKLNIKKQAGIKKQV